MKCLAVVLPLLAVLPLAAQSWDVTVFEGRQSYRTAGATDPNSDLTQRLSTPAKTITALRAGWSALDLDLVSLQVTAAYQPVQPATQNSYFPQTYPTTPYATYDYKAGYAALGAMVRFKLLVDVALGLDYRFEQLSAQGYSTSYDRPWARATVGWAFPLAKVSPIVGAEAAYPLTSRNLQLLDLNSTLQATAPRSQLGVYAGVRF